MLFLTIEKYIQSKHKVGNIYVLVAPTTQKEIVYSLREEELNSFFTDIDKIKNDVR